MGYVLNGTTHETGHFGENGTLLVKAVRVAVFEAVDGIVVGDKERPLVEGDAVRPIEVIDRFVHGVGAAIAVFVGQGQHRALATGDRGPCMPRLHVGHV